MCLRPARLGTPPIAPFESVSPHAPVATNGTGPHQIRREISAVAIPAGTSSERACSYAEIFSTKPLRTERERDRRQQDSEGSR